MGGEPDERPRPHLAPRLRRREVLLAHVHPVRLGRNGEVHPVVDEEEGSELPRTAPGDRCEGEQGAGLQSLVPQLHDVDARLEHPGQELVQRPGGRLARRDEVQPGSTEALTRH